MKLRITGLTSLVASAANSPKTNMTTLLLRNSPNQWFLWRGFLLIPLALGWFRLSPTIRTVRQFRSRVNAFAAVAFICAVVAGHSSAAQITFETYDLLASFHTDGLYNLAGLNFWNGKPVSATNKPTDYERQLAATINFFAKPKDHNILFLQVTDVTATHFGFAFGTAFFNITQTGVLFTLPSKHDLGTPILSLGFANAGEIRVYAPPDGSSEPLTTTPGFGLSRPGQNQLLIQTVSGADYGFINNGWTVFGGPVNRIVGGGVFEMIFPRRVNLFRDVNFRSTTVKSQYGAGSQYIGAARVAESGGTFELFMLAVATILGRRWFCLPKRAS